MKVRALPFERMNKSLLGVKKNDASVNDRGIPTSTRKNGTNEKIGKNTQHEARHRAVICSVSQGLVCMVSLSVSDYCNLNQRSWLCRDGLPSGCSRTPRAVPAGA